MQLFPELRQRLRDELPQEVKRLHQQYARVGVAGIWKTSLPQGGWRPRERGVALNPMKETPVREDLTFTWAGHNRQPMKPLESERQGDIVKGLVRLQETIEGEMKLPAMFPFWLFWASARQQFFKGARMGYFNPLSAAPALLYKRWRELVKAYQAILESLHAPSLSVEDARTRSMTMSLATDELARLTYEVNNSFIELLSLIRALPARPHSQQSAADSEDPGAAPPEWFTTLRDAHFVYGWFWTNIHVAYLETVARLNIILMLKRQKALDEGHENPITSLQTAWVAFCQVEQDYTDSVLAFAAQLGQDDEQPDKVNNAAQEVVQNHTQRIRAARTLLEKIKEVGEVVDEHILACVSPEKNARGSRLGFFYELLPSDARKGVGEGEEEDPAPSQPQKRGVEITGHTPYLSGPLTAIAEILEAHLPHLEANKPTPPTKNPRHNNPSSERRS